MNAEARKLLRKLRFYKQPMTYENSNRRTSILLCACRVPSCWDSLPSTNTALHLLTVLITCEGCYSFSDSRKTCIAPVDKELQLQWRRLLQSYDIELNSMRFAFISRFKLFAILHWKAKSNRTLKRHNFASNETTYTRHFQRTLHFQNVQRR